VLDELLDYLDEHAAAIEGRARRPPHRLRADVARVARRMSRWLSDLPARVGR
jgi:hypothetical protein